MVDINLTMSLFTLNANRINIIKSQRENNFLIKTQLTLFIRYFHKYKDTDMLKIRGWKRTCHAKTNHKEVSVTINIR
jgi:hypothetical protein